MDLYRKELKRISDNKLEQRLKHLAQREREALVELLLTLAEFDKRKISEKKSFSSLFVYCIQELGYSEDAAYYRIHAARAIERFPAIVDMLKAGELSLTAIVRLAPHLNKENYLELLQQVQGKTLREVNFLIAGLAPRTVYTDCIRSLTQIPPSAPQLAASRQSAHLPETMGPQAIRALHSPEKPMLRQIVKPLSSETVRIAFTADKSFLVLLDRAREVLRHKCPSGRLEDVFREALEDCLDKRDPERHKSRALSVRGLTKCVQDKYARTIVPSDKRKRRIPAWVKSEVWKRDGGCCAYVSEEGRRCNERGGLEYDHIIPWALGGVSDNSQNLRLLCRAHNQYVAREVFGK